MRGKSKTIKYILSPSHIYSEHDGQRHWIGGRQLAQLYGVDLCDCVISKDTDWGNLIGDADLSQLMRQFPDARVLTPQYHYEDYIRIAKQIRAREEYLSNTPIDRTLDKL